MENYKFLLADKNDLSISGMKFLIQQMQESFDIVGVVKNFNQLLKKLHSTKVDMLILDYTNIEDFTILDFQILINDFPQIKFLVLSSDENREVTLKVLDSGISGYLTKECSNEEIIHGIRVVTKGEKFFCTRIFNLLLEKQIKKEELEQHENLTQRELEIIELIVKGNSTMVIADKLNLSPHTINSHRKNILKKLKIKSPTELVIYAIDKGLIKLNP